MATRIIQLCNTPKCYRPAAFWSANKNKFVCEGCADPDGIRGGFGAHANDTDVLTPVEPRSGSGWEVA